MSLSVWFGDGTYHSLACLGHVQCIGCSRLLQAGRPQCNMLANILVPLLNN